MHQISVIDTRDYNLRCFKVEKRGESFVISNAETFLESCEEKTWKKNLPLALARLSEHSLEKEIVFILPEANCMNLIVSTQEDPQLDEKQKIAKALHKEFGLHTDRSIFKFLQLSECRYAVSLISHKFWSFFKPLVEKTLPLADKQIYCFPPFIGHWAYFHKKFNMDPSSQMMLFVEKKLRRFIAKTEEGLHFLDFRTSGKEPSNLWNELFGTQKFIQQSFNMPSGVKHWTIVGENCPEKIALYNQNVEKFSCEVEEKIPEIFGVEPYLNPSEQSLLLGLLTNLVNKDKFSVFDFSKVHLSGKFNWQFFKYLRTYGLPLLLFYVLCMTGMVWKQVNDVNYLEKNYQKLCQIQKQITALKTENKQYEKQAYAKTYLASTFVAYFQLFYELPFQVCLDCMQVLPHKKQSYLDIQGHVSSDHIGLLQAELMGKLEKQMGIKQTSKVLFEITNESSELSFFKLQIPLYKFPKLLSSFL